MPLQQRRASTPSSLISAFVFVTHPAIDLDIEFTTRSACPVPPPVVCSEGIPLLSCGVKLYFLLFPTFYVELESATAAATALTELRIATAGVWHNLVLAVAVWILAGGSGGRGKEPGPFVWGGLSLGTYLGEGLGLWERLEEGVLVTAVDRVSVPPPWHGVS